MPKGAARSAAGLIVPKALRKATTSEKSTVPMGGAISALLQGGSVMQSPLATPRVLISAIEQPLHHLDLAGHAFIRRALPYPVVLDEAITSPAAIWLTISVASFWMERRPVRVSSVSGVPASVGIGAV